MVLGAIGVAMAMHAHLEQRMDVLAILKAVGAGSSDLLRIFLLQTLGLGLAGGLLGVAAGLAVMESLPAVFGNLLPVHTVLAFPWRSIGAGLGTGLLTTLLFCLPPLLDVRAVRPVLVLRRLVESGPDTIAGFFARIWARRLQLSLAVVVVAGLGAIAWALSDSRVVGPGSPAGPCRRATGSSGPRRGYPSGPALPPQPRPPAPAQLPAPWPGQPLSPRQPVRGRPRLARHRRHAHPRRLPYAVRHPQRHQADRLAHSAEHVSHRHHHRGVRAAGNLIQPSARRHRAARPHAIGTRQHYGAQRQDA